ncbi:MAG TPA: tetratricopeptide repeat protein [Polyangiaceae bacterium]|nr:tetratricopeptide repeat protein [Polyangiaceae bacterium]
MKFTSPTPRSLRTSAVLVLVCAMFCSGQARAQSNDELDARATYESGLAHFGRGEYAEAMRDLERAYQSYPAPELLYDIAQAARLQGECAQAMNFYARFLATHPSEPLLSRASMRLADMDRCVQQRAALAQGTSPVAVPSAAGSLPDASVERAADPMSLPERRQVVTPPVEKRASSSPRLPVLLTLGGVAAASFAVGGLALARYFDSNSQAEQLCPAACSESEADLHNELTHQARSARPWVYAGFGVGMAASVALVAVIVWPRNAPSMSARALTLQPGFDSGGVELRASLAW